MGADFFQLIRPLFGQLTQIQVDRINAVLERLDKTDIPLSHKAYILATAHHESDRFKTLEEYASGKAYEGRLDLGNTMPGDGVRFKGRGLVQITGRRNYGVWSNRLGINLVATPYLASNLKNAVEILVGGMIDGTFTGKKLADFNNYLDMRRVVNGTDRAEQIARYAQAYEKALSLQKPVADPPISAPQGLWARIIAAILRLLGVK